MENFLRKYGSSLVDLNGVRLVKADGTVVFADGSEQVIPPEDARALIQSYSFDESAEAEATTA